MAVKQRFSRFGCDFIGIRDYAHLQFEIGLCTHVGIVEGIVVCQCGDYQGFKIIFYLLHN